MENFKKIIGELENTNIEVKADAYLEYLNFTKTSSEYNSAYDYLESLLEPVLSRYLNNTSIHLLYERMTHSEFEEIKEGFRYFLNKVLVLDKAFLIFYSIISHLDKSVQDGDFGDKYTLEQVLYSLGYNCFLSEMHNRVVEDSYLGEVKENIIQDFIFQKFELSVYYY